MTVLCGLGHRWASHGVKNNEALRQAHHTVQPEVVQFSLRFGQSPALYQGLKSLQASGTWQTLDATQQRIVEKLIEDAELSGAGLHGAIDNASMPYNRNWQN